MALDRRVAEETRRSRSVIIHALEENPDGLTPTQVSQLTGIPINRCQNYLRQIVGCNLNVASKSVTKPDGRKESVYRIKKV